MKHFIPILFALFFFEAHSQIDSTIFRPNPAEGKDALVWSINPYSIYGHNQEATLTQWTYQGAQSTKRFYIEFDLTKLPDCITIDSSYLFLYNNPTAPSHDGKHSGSNRFYIRRVTSPWSESTITFNNQPTHTNTGQLLVPSTNSSNQNFKIDVSNLIHDMLNTNNYGFYLRLETEITYRAIVCASSDHSDPNLRPGLKVYYRKTCLSLPNIFTPNFDGENDLFTPVNSSGISSSYTRIYNRWGKLVFETFNPFIEWDGGEQSDGVYYWVIEYTDNYNAEHSLNGTITLMR